MKKANSSRLTAKQRLELDALADLPDEEIDTTDIPEVRDWSGAKRGIFYRPVKKQLTLRIGPTSSPGSRTTRRRAKFTRPR